jgi:RNA polymerase sigma-70 factor (ECF subfamily)
MEIDVAEYYKRYGPMVLRRCRWILKDENKALDAMQDTFVQLIRYKDKLKGNYPSSLLYRIATNICLNVIRNENRRKETGDDDLLSVIASSQDVHGEVEARDLLHRIFNREKESTQTIAVMYLIDGMTLEQVAEEVGMSVSGVRKRLRTLRSRVKELEEV